jgi:hypothetical protein
MKTISGSDALNNLVMERGKRVGPTGTIYQVQIIEPTHAAFMRVLVVIFTVIAAAAAVASAA